MKEYYLQMAWKLVVLAGQTLQTVQGDSIEIIFPGYGPSVLGGPDFSFAKIKIKDTLWVGSVEVHVKSSFWYMHRHGGDEKYDNVILHVVWENDVDVKLSNGETIPCLQLKQYIAASWFEEIDQRIFSASSIPCARLLYLVPEAVWQSQLDVALVERVERRVKEVELLYKHCHYDWDEALHRLIARFMGQKINNQCMEQLAASISYKILLKHASSLIDLEALLLGQGGFLEEENQDNYTKELKHRHEFLSYKYGLKKNYNLKMQWQYKGLRPISFPELRIAQWAYLLYEKGRLMNWAVECSIDDLKEEEYSIGEYWKTHYRLGKKCKSHLVMNKHWNSLLLINALIPFRIAYKKNTDNKEMAVFIGSYEEIAPEKNHVVKLFKSFNHQAFSARDSQAMLELYNNYCNYKKCLSCKIGHVILKKEGLL
ncbi:MAG TPA: DUF2851 family protein [Cytophagaceae bacterium]|jgi:hypothetical protein|nr:DUF2851 family protein [Cytophagaceae bacterium]